MRITVVGDSNSTGFSGTLENGMAAGTAWAAHLPEDRFALVDGWAVDGATTTAMADAAASVAAGDVLVVMGGTNDLALGVSTATVLAELRRIVDAVGAPVVAVAAIAPLDFLPEEVVAFNSDLERFANTQGWVFIDPWRNVRSPDGTWVAAYRTDGIHTSAEGYAEAASEIARQLRSALRE